MAKWSLTVPAGNACMQVLPGCQLVLLLARAWSRRQRQLTDRSQVADHFVQFAELSADLQQFAWIGSQVLHISAPRLLQHVFSFLNKNVESLQNHRTKNKYKKTHINVFLQLKCNKD